jgi:hypothetical protein
MGHDSGRLLPKLQNVQGMKETRVETAFFELKRHSVGLLMTARRWGAVILSGNMWKRR